MLSGCRRILLLALISCFSMFLSVLHASGVNEDSIIEKVQVGSGKNAQKYVLMNSRLNEHQWYCARLSPVLVENGQGKNVEPDLTLIRFQKLDSRNPEKIHEGGILRFSFAIGPDKSTINALRKKLPKNVDQRLARIDPLPLTGVEMTLFSPPGKKITLVATAAQGIAADYAAQYAKFSAVFSTVDSDLIESLVNSNTGVKYELNYRYSTLSESKTSNIKVDFDKLGRKANKNAEDELLDNEGAKADAALVNYLKRQAANPRISQRLRAEAAKREKSAEPDAAVDKTYDARSDGRKPVRSVDRDASRPTVKISQLLRSVTLVHRSRAQKYLAAQGFLSLSGYPEEVRNKRIINDTGYDDWKYAYLLMPTIGELPDLNIDKVSLKVTLTDGSHIYETRLYEWTPATQWLDASRAPASIARFPLRDVLAAGPRYYDKAFFQTEYSVFVADDPPITGGDDIPVFTGDMPLSTPLELADMMMFDFSALYWDAPESDKKRLLKVEINLRDDKRHIKRFVAPTKRADRLLVYPELVPILMSRGNFDKGGKVKISLFFHTADRKRIPWDFNGMDLREPFPDAWLIFLDNDWQKH